MKRSLTALAVCSAFLVTAGEAAADTWNAGTLAAAPSVHTFTHIPGSFDDFVNFNIASLPSDLGASAVPLNLTFMGIQYVVTGLTGYLYDGLNGTGNQKGTMPGDNGT